MFLAFINLNAQNCKKIVLTTQKKYHNFTYSDLSSSMRSSTMNRNKREYVEELIKPIFENEQIPDIIIYLKENKGIYTAKIKSSNSENVNTITKIDVFKKDILFIYLDDYTTLLLNLDNKSAIYLDTGLKLNLNTSPCEF
jgi:hypothetical protein